jgi:protein TonB
VPIRAIGEYLERKRWMSYASQQQGLTGPKLVALIIALSIVGAVGTGMVLFLAVDAVKEAIERVTTVEGEEEEKPPEPEEPPPPPPDEQPVETTQPPPPNAPPMPFDLPSNNQAETTQNPTPPGPPERQASQNTDPAPPGPPSPPKPPSKARGVQPKGQKRWSAQIQENYPRRAIQEEIQGTVRVRVTVTADGRATSCSVTKSSGSDILDSAACKDIERYARFDPALNDAGDPINASWSTSITYNLD